MFNSNNIDTRRKSCVFIVSFVVYFLPFSSFSIFVFEQVNAGWVSTTNLSMRFNVFLNSAANTEGNWKPLKN